MGRSESMAKSAVPHELPTLAGLTRQVDVGLRLSAAPGAALVLAKSLAAILDTAPNVPVRLVGVGGDHDRVALTLAITLGAIDEIKAAGPHSLAALALITGIVEQLAAHDPAFTVIPDPQSAEARLADRLHREPASDGVLAQSGLLSLIG